MCTRELPPVTQSERTSRDWLQVAMYQPVDVKVKHVEVPLVKIVEKRVPRIIYKEKLIEVPRFTEKVIERIEKPCIRYVDRYEVVPNISWKIEYVPGETVDQRLVFSRKPLYKKAGVLSKEEPVITYMDRHMEAPEYEEELCIKVRSRARCHLSGGCRVAVQTTERTVDQSAGSGGAVCRACVLAGKAAPSDRGSEFTYTVRYLNVWETAGCCPERLSSCRSSCCHGSPPP